MIRKVLPKDVLQGFRAEAGGEAKAGEAGRIRRRN